MFLQGIRRKLLTHARTVQHASRAVVDEGSPIDAPFLCVAPVSYTHLDVYKRQYQDKVEKDVCYETLSEDEPTVYEFKTWMQDISDFIKEKGQRKFCLLYTSRCV